MWKKKITQLSVKCIRFYVNDTGKDFNIDVREVHNLECGGDPNTEPRIITLSVDKKSGQTKAVK
ncbi:MAG: hypothetical protein JSR33_01305 [Proteobacteria bacterium]|nr:hypothetical protein [Pseudomonadota bacterium]